MSKYTIASQITPRELPVINISGNNSYGNNTANSVINTIFEFGLLALTGAAANKTTSGKEATNKAAAQQQAIIAQYSNSENIQAEIKQLSTQIQNINTRKTELQKLLDGTTQTKVKQLNNEIEKLNKKTYNNNNIKLDDIATKISERDSAISNKHSLETQFAADKIIINQNKTIANANITTITILNQPLNVPNIDNNGNITGDSFVKQYQSAMDAYSQKTPPNKEDNKSSKYAEKLNQYNAYQVALGQQAMVTAKDEEVQRKSNAIKALNQYKTKYGDNLDGSGGSYNKQMKEYDNTIQEINTFEKNNADAFSDYNTRALKISEKSNAEALIKSYTQTPNDSSTLNKTAIQAKINECDEQISKISKTVEKLNNLIVMNSSISANEQIDKNADQKDGNWFTRLFNKGKRSIHKERKNTQTIIANQKQLQQQEIIKLFKEMAEMEVKSSS